MTQWTIALRQIRRNGLRSLLMGMGVALFAAVLVALTLVAVGISQSLRQTVDRLGADLMLIPRGQDHAAHFNAALITGKPTTFYLPSTLGPLIAANPDVRKVSAQTFAQTLTNAKCCAGSFFLVGFDPATDFTIQPWLSAPLETLAPDATDWILVGDRILLKEGERVKLYGKMFRVAGVLSPTGMGMDWSIYLPQPTLERLVGESSRTAEAPLQIPESNVSTFFIRAREGVDLIDLAESLEEAHPALQAILSSSVGKRARGQLALTLSLSLVLLGVVWLVAALLSGVVFSQAVRERQGEFGLLLAKGADRGFILGTLAKESLMIAFAASLLGALLALLLLFSFRQLLASSLTVASVLPGGLTLGALVAALTLLGSLNALVCSLLPALNMLRGEPYEAIKGAKTA